MGSNILDSLGLGGGGIDVHITVSPACGLEMTVMEESNLTLVFR